MFFMAMFPYHVVPPLGVKNTHTSTALAVVVRDNDAAPPGNKNVPPDQATVRLGVASLVRIRVKDDDPVAIGADNVNVQLPVRVAVKTLPLVQVIV